MPTSPLPPDPYKTLGVAKDATLASIRSSYRKLVLLSHPDKFLDEEVKAQKAEEFHRVQQAYEILSDEKARERYDAQVRLAELKAERFREEANSPRRQEPPYSPRPSAERVWTSQPIFEEIRPKARHYDDGPSFPRSEPRYEEPRSRPRDYDDYDDCIPAHGATKKAGSSRTSEVRPDDNSNRARNRWRAAGNAAKATAAFTKSSSSREYEESRRTRDRVRRDDTQSKRHNRSSFDGDTGSDTEPEIISFMSPSYSSHKKEASRSYEDERHHSRRKHESRTSSPDREAKANHNWHSAAEYIAKSKATSVRRSSVGRSQSVNQIPQAPPPPPPVPIPTNVEDVVRSSARRNATSKSSKSSKRDGIEIVEPPRKRDYDPDARIPEIKPSATSPTTLKPPSRSSTMEIRGSEPARNTMRRSATSPLTPLSSTSHSQKPSKLGRDAHDSEYSSSGTPDNQSSRTKTTTAYRVPKVSDSDSDTAAPRVVLLEPTESRRPQAARESSLHSVSHRSERMASNVKSPRHATVRSNTDDHASHHHRPGLSRGATDRPSLYGEIPHRSSPEARVQYNNIQESRRINKDDIHYSTYQRRPSPSDHDHGHAYEHSRRGSIPLRSGLSARG